MRTRLAEALGIAIDAVSVKATTSEGMGFVGRDEGAAAYAVALIERLEGLTL
jgi:2-C-methyl-D-erythritol 2,4-cyclodiphosphate synthase